MPYDSNTAAESGKKSTRKGVPNKSTSVGRDQLVDLMTGQLDKIEKELQGLTGRDYLDTVVKFLPYVFPKQSQVVENYDVSQMSDDEVDALVDQIESKLNL